MEISGVSELVMFWFVDRRSCFLPITRLPRVSPDCCPPRPVMAFRGSNELWTAAESDQGSHLLQRRNGKLSEDSAFLRYKTCNLVHVKSSCSMMSSPDSRFKLWAASLSRSARKLGQPNLSNVSLERSVRFVVCNQDIHDRQRRRHARTPMLRRAYRP